ncbi:MAG: hypothetical protein J6V69_03455, partial [Clostridia bacterium]|nr:hypothetical protein [Clostridia bacterium]
MKKKVLLVLLVVLMVGILALSVFACNKNTGNGPSNNPGPKPPANEEEDLGVNVDAGPMLNDLIDSVNNTIKVVNTIEDKASVNAELYVDVVLAGENGAETTYNVDLKIAGSLDKSTNANNWALVTANVLDTVEIGLFAEVTSAGKEYLYLGQNILNEEFTWSKLSQAQDAGLVQDKVLDAVFGLVADLEDAKFAADDETFKGADVSDTIDSGLLNKIGIINTIKGLGGTIGGLLFAPIDGINTIVDNETDLSSANGYAARLNIEQLSGVISGVMPMLGGLLGDVNLADYQGIVDMVVPLILGGNLDLTTLTFTPIEGAIPDIRLLVDINDDNTFGGVHLSYESEMNGIYVGFSLDNITFTNKSSKASNVSVYDDIEDAEELAINLGLDIELEAINGGYANLDLNVYPNLSLGFDEDGYLAIDFSKLYAEVVMTREVEDWDENWETIYVPQSAVIAQYNADGQEDLIIDLDTVGTALNAGGRFYRVPVDLSKKYAEFIESEKSKGAIDESAPEVQNAGLVDDIIGIVGDLTAENADIVGVIMDAAGKIGTIIDEVSALAQFITEDGTIDVEGLINNLIAEDGLIGESEETIYIGEMEIVLGDIADDIATDKVLGSIAELAGVEVADIIEVVYNVTGATLDAEDAYANMEIGATGFWQDGIGATITAVLGKDDNTAEIKLGLNASIIENKTEYEDTLGATGFYTVDLIAAQDGAFVDLSTDTSKDGGKLLLDNVKSIINAVTNNANICFDTYEIIYAEKVSDADAEDAGFVTAYNYSQYAFIDSGYGLRFWVDAVEGSTVYVYNVMGGEAVAQWIKTPMLPMPQMDMHVIFAESDNEAVFTVVGTDGFMFTVYGAGEGSAVAFSIGVAEPETEEPEDEGFTATALTEAGEYTTPEFVQGTSLADPGIQSYAYSYTADADCTLTITFGADADINVLNVIGGMVMGNE